MRATAPTNVSPAWRAPTWVVGKGQKQSSYRRRFDRLVCEVNQPLIHLPGKCSLSARSGLSKRSVCSWLRCHRPFTNARTSSISLR